MKLPRITFFLANKTLSVPIAEAELTSHSITASYVLSPNTCDTPMALREILKLVFKARRELRFSYLAKLLHMDAPD